MKKFCIFLLILFVQTNSIIAQEDLFLQISDPEYIDLQNSSEHIDKVVTNKSKTLVYLSCSGSSETNVIVPKNTYIIDENGCKYHVIKANGIVLGKKKSIGREGKLSYTLTFPSLPKGTKSFDLVQSQNNTKTYYFNIHQSGSTVNIATSIDTTGMYEALNKTFSDHLFRKDTVHISGRFKGSKEFEKRKYAITFVTPIPSLNGGSYSEKFEINPDGTFNATIPVLGPTWTELIVLVPNTPLVSRTIPVMLYPKEDLSLVVDDYDSECAKINWVSKYEINEKFVEMSDVFPARYPYYNEGQLVSLDSLKQTIAVSEQAACYLSDKYKLSKTESALLLAQANMSKVCEALRTIDQYVQYNKTNFFKSLDRKYPTPAQFDTLQNCCKSQLYTVLSLLRAENKAFLIVPSLQSLTRTINQSPLFHAISYQKNYESIPVDYRPLYWNDSAIHLIRMFRNKPIGRDRLFEQWFNLASLETTNEDLSKTSNMAEVLKMKIETVTLPIYNSWKSELLRE